MGKGRGECVVGSDGHERRKRRKRTHEGTGVADGFASAGDITHNVKGGDDESKRGRRKKRKSELDNGRHEELEKHQKDRKKRLGDDDGIRSESEGVNSKKKKKKKKKHEHSLVDDKGAEGERREALKKGKWKKENCKDEGTTDQPDSRNLDYIKEEEKNKRDKKRDRKEDKKEKKKKSTKDKPVKESSRKVRFADKVEIFPSLGGPGVENAKENGQLVRGKHFSLQEDELVKKAVYNYIETRGLGEDGLSMVLHCSKHVGIRGCWKDIGAFLPWRPHRSVYERAHVLFERSENRSWTEEERELIKKFHAEHGPRWKTLADTMGRYRLHVNNMWRRMRMPDRRKGQWTQEEHQTLFDLVNRELQTKALQEKVPNHRMLRDNIGWEAISQKLSTRLEYACCAKWYHQLSSPMVAEGIWADGDDYRLLNALVGLDACSMEEVDWDGLIQNRPGDVCRKRWAQMVRHIGEHRQKSFVEQVEILSQRYCPSLVEAREACDRKRLKN